MRKKLLLADRRHRVRSVLLALLLDENLDIARLLARRAEYLAKKTKEATRKSRITPDEIWRALGPWVDYDSKAGRKIKARRRKAKVK